MGTQYIQFLIVYAFLSNHFKEMNCTLVMPRMQLAEYVDEGDINIGFLISIHDDEDDVTSSNMCSESFYSRTYSIQLSETMAFATREINRRADLLPNITLGFVVKDGCSKDLSSLARALYFIPDHSQKCTGARPVDDVSNSPVHRKVAGIIGPGNSRQAVMVAPLMSAAQIPTLGTYCSSDELSDRTRFEYFMRLVPPDRAQVRALLDVARYFGWSYIAVLYTDGSYGEFGYKAVEEITKEYGICIGYSRKLLGNSGDEDSEEVVRGLELHHQAKAVILIGSGSPLRRTFQ